MFDPGGAAMQRAVHAATTILPHLRRGLTPDSAGSAAPALRVLTGADAVALVGRDALLAFDGAGDDHHAAGDQLEALVPARREDARARRAAARAAPRRGCPLRSAIVAPLVVRERAGRRARRALRAAGPRCGWRSRAWSPRRPRSSSAMVELSELEAQGERLARAELRALRAQISPHFIYNALAAVAAFIHSRPEEARELLIEFSEFIRYAFARQRPYVTLADELQYVEKYLRLEQARFGERLRVRVQVDPEVLHAVVPVLSLQPLVENAVRHGVESRAEGGLVSIEGRDLGADVELRVSDDGAGHRPRAARPRRSPGADRASGWATCTAACRARSARATGSWSRTATGTTVVMTLPKFRAGVRAG